MKITQQLLSKPSPSISTSIQKSNLISLHICTFSPQKNHHPSFLHIESATFHLSLHFILLQYVLTNPIFCLVSLTKQTSGRFTLIASLNWDIVEGPPTPYNSMPISSFTYLGPFMAGYLHQLLTNVHFLYPNLHPLP